MDKKIEIFLCYAHEDEELQQRLVKQLRSLQHQDLVSLWYDRNISAGSEWESEINAHLDTAQIILVLVSPDFMDSHYCYSIEMERAIERHKQANAHVIPIILRPTEWQTSPLKNLNALPKDAKPVTLWKNRDVAFLDIAKGIREVAEMLISSSMLIQPPAENIDNIQKRALLYYCYISEAKVEQILAQNRYDAVDINAHTIHELHKNQGSLSKILHEMFGGEGTYGKTTASHIWQERNRRVVTKLIAAMRLLETQFGDLPLLAEKIQQGQSIRPGAYLYYGEFGVSRYDEQFVYLEASLPMQKMLKLTCSFKYFSEKDENGKWIIHSGNTMFFSGEIQPTFQSLLYVLAAKEDTILGTPVFLGLPLESPVQL